MCYQARRTAWAQIQIVHVQLWWADLNLENRAWEEVNNRTWKLKGSSPERPRAMFWAWSFGSWSVQTWGEAGWHPVPIKMVWVLQRHYWGFIEYKPEGTSEVIFFHLPILQMSLEHSWELNWLDQSIETEPAPHQGLQINRCLTT